MKTLLLFITMLMLTSCATQQICPQAYSKSTAKYKSKTYVVKNKVAYAKK